MNILHEVAVIFQIKSLQQSRNKTLLQSFKDANAVISKFSEDAQTVRSGLPLSIVQSTRLAEFELSLRLLRVDLYKVTT